MYSTVYSDRQGTAECGPIAHVFFVVASSARTVWLIFLRSVQVGIFFVHMFLLLSESNRVRGSAALLISPLTTASGFPDRRPSQGTSEAPTPVSTYERQRGLRPPGEHLHFPEIKESS